MKAFVFVVEINFNISSPFTFLPSLSLSLFVYGFGGVVVGLGLTHASNQQTTKTAYLTLEALLAEAPDEVLAVRAERRLLEETRQELVLLHVHHALLLERTFAGASAEATAKTATGAEGIARSTEHRVVGGWGDRTTATTTTTTGRGRRKCRRLCSKFILIIILI